MKTGAVRTIVFVVVVLISFISCGQLINDRFELGQSSGTSGTVYWKCDLAVAKLVISGTADQSEPCMPSSFDGFPADQISLITIGSSVCAFGPGAFRGFIHVQSLEIPAAVTYIGAGAFSDWTSDQTIRLGWTSSDTTSRTLSGLQSNCRAVVYYSDGVLF